MILKKRNRILVILILIVNTIVSSLLTVNRTRGILLDSYENNHRVVSGMISNALDNNFLRPITVAETMANDTLMEEILSAKNSLAAAKKAQKASDYLSSIRDGFGYTMVYAVSDLSKAYFSCNGISTYVDPENNESDAWYKNYVASGLPYVLDVDTDTANNWSLSVFVNRGVYNEDKELIGVCGIGVDMGELQNELEKFERIYDVKIDLVDMNGLIQVDTDMARIEHDYIDIRNLANYADGECYYEIAESGNRTITYLENLHWFLVVENEQSVASNILFSVEPSIICSVVSIVLILFILLYHKKENKVTAE